MPNAPRQFKPRHAEQAKREQRQRKGSSTAKGYGRSWQRFRAWYFSFACNAVCGCGCGREATELDHIEAVVGADDPRFQDLENVLGLAIGCHSRKTVQANRGMGNQPSAEGRAMVERFKAETRRRAQIMQEADYGYAG